MIYVFEQFRLDPAERCLARGEKRLPLPPKAIDTLLTLVESRGRLVTKEELLDRVWPDTHVTDATLAQNVFTVRKVLEENGSGGPYIETVPKRGYRFVAPVQVDEVTQTTEVAPAKAAHGAPEIAGTPRSAVARTLVRGSIAIIVTVAALTLYELRSSEPKPPTNKTMAYQAWLLGRHQWARRPEGIPAAIRHFREAIERDPRYVDAYVGLAQCYATAPERNGHVEAIALARYALSLDPSRGDAHAVLGMAAMKMFDWPTAEREYRAALQMEPNDASTRTFYGVLLMARGRVDAAIEQLREAVELDPASVNTNITLGAALIYANRHGEAIDRLRRTLELNPASHWVRLRLAQAYLVAGRSDEALAELKRVRHVNPNLGDVALAHAYAALGKPYDALRHLRQLPEDGAGGAYRMALVYAGLGDNDSAFRWLDRAVAERHWDLYAIQIDQRLEGLRSDPRYEKVVAAVRLRP